MSRGDRTTERAFVRFGALRERLHAGISRALELDGHHKSYEGSMELDIPPVFGGEYRLKLYCYVLGPSRHYEYKAATLDEIMDEVEADVERWIQENEDADWSEG